MTEKITLNERQQSIDKCLKACVNLYGYVTPRQFLKVYNRYNTPKLLKKELLEHADALEAVSGKYYAVYENAIINTRVSKTVIDETIRQQAEKTYYTPTEAEVETYSRASGYTRTAQTENLTQFLVKKMRMNVFTAQGFVSKLVWLTATGEPMQKCMTMLYEFNLPVKTQAQLKEIFNLMQAVNVSSRKWAECGYVSAQERE